MSQDGVLEMQPDGGFQPRDGQGRFAPKSEPTGVHEVQGAPAPHLDTTPPELKVHTPDAGAQIVRNTGQVENVADPQTAVQTASDMQA